MMKAVRVDEFGDENVLKVKKVEVVTPADDEILVKVLTIFIFWQLDLHKKRRTYKPECKLCTLRQTSDSASLINSF